MKIYEDTTRFVFQNYSDRELQILRRLISADGNTFLFETEDYVACPIGVEKYIRRKFPQETIEERKPWDSAKMKFIPKSIPDPKNRLQKDALKFLRENKDRNQLGLITKTGSGKCQPYSTMIPTPNGPMRMGDLKVGDYVYSKRGIPTPICHIYEQGKRAVYRVVFEDGRCTETTIEHLWNAVQLDENLNPTELEITTAEIAHKLEVGQSVYVPLCDPVDYEPKSKFVVDPYVHGCMLFHHKVKPEDAQGMIVLTRVSEDLRYYIEGHRIHLTSVHGRTYVLSDGEGPLRCGDQYDEILDPEIYDRILYGTVYQRQQFMAGVIHDCCSLTTIDDNDVYKFHLDNPNTIDKVLQIAYSLGWKGNRLSQNQFTIVVPNQYQVKSTLLKMIDVQLVYGKQQCRCIEVEDTSHTYLTNDYIVTHNTYMSINHAIRVGEKALVICPTTSILDQWVQSLIGMFKIPADRILHITGTEKLRQMSGDYDWVLVLEQTLQTLVKKRTLEEELKKARFGIKITDEIHMFLRNNIAIDCSSNIKRSLYCTGTFFRTQDEESNLFNAIYHNILRFEVVDEDEMVRYGQPRHIELYSVVINSHLTKREVNHIVIMAKIGRKTVPTVSVGRYMDIVCPRDGRITPYMEQSLKVIKRMRERVSYGRMLVLVPSIYSTQQFRKLLAEMFPKLKVGCINSEQSRYLNNTVKEEADIVVSTSKSAGVGFDMADLSVLVSVEQFRSAVLVEQIAGRLRPRKDKKNTFYVDIADSALGSYLLKWREDRLTLLKKKAVSYHQFRLSGDK